MNKRIFFVSAFAALNLIFLGCSEIRRAEVTRKTDELYSAESLLSNASERARAFAVINTLASDKDPFVRTQVALLLGRVGKTNASEMHAYALPLLLRMLTDTGFSVQRTAIQSIRPYKAHAESTVTLLSELVQKYPDGDIGWFAAETLEEIGKAARPAIPALLYALKYEGKSPGYQYTMRKRVVSALGEISDYNPVVVAALNDQMNTPDQGVRIEVAAAISKILNRAEKELIAFPETHAQR